MPPACHDIGQGNVGPSRVWRRHKSSSALAQEQDAAVLQRTSIFLLYPRDALEVALPLALAQPGNIASNRQFRCMWVVWASWAICRSIAASQVGQRFVHSMRGN